MRSSSSFKNFGTMKNWLSILLFLVTNNLLSQTWSKHYDFDIGNDYATHAVPVEEGVILQVIGLCDLNSIECRGLLKLDFDGNFKYSDIIEVEITPLEFSLSQNYPNPFNPSTSIKYAIGSRQFVTLKVYDVLGNEVAILVNEEKPAGSYEIEFKSSVGSHQLASGVYYYQLRAGDFIQTKKMILLK